MIRAVFFRTLVLTALIAPAVALTLIVRRSELLPGEAALTRWLARETGRPGDVLSDFLDFISAESVAPFIFAAALLVVWRLWGQYPAGVLGVAGLLTAAMKITAAGRQTAANGGPRMELRVHRRRRIPFLARHLCGPRIRANRLLFVQVRRASAAAVDDGRHITVPSYGSTREYSPYCATAPRGCTGWSVMSARPGRRHDPVRRPLPDSQGSLTASPWSYPEGLLKLGST